MTLPARFFYTENHYLSSQPGSLNESFFWIKKEKYREDIW